MKLFPKWKVPGYEAEEWLMENNNNLPTYNELAKEIHELAVSKGWWPEGEEKDYEELGCLFHSELSEAFEEYRNGKPMLYFVCNRTGNKTEVCLEAECGNWENGKCLGNVRGQKPEGIAVELADCVIRILDFLAWAGIKENDARIEIKKITCVSSTLPKVVFACHYWISATTNCLTAGFDKKIAGKFLSHVVWLIYNHLWENGIDLKELILLKHEYNKTRPWRHGGKVC